MDDKMIDKILDDIVSEVGPKAIEEMAKDDLKNIDQPSFAFSKEHEEKMQKLFEEFDKENSKKKNEGKKRQTVKISTPKKLLIIAAATILISAIAITSVGAWRESFVKYILNIQEEYSEVKNNNVNVLREGKDFRADTVYFGYIPSEYEFASYKELSQKEMITFLNEPRFIILEIENNVVLGETNTESGEIEEIVINGKDMVYFERDDLKLLNWFEKGKINLLSTNDSKEVLLKVAENIKFVEDESQEN